MLLVFFMFQAAQALPKQTLSNRSQKFDFGICAGITSECLFPAIKVGVVHDYWGIGLSISPAFFAAALSFRFYPKVEFPVRPYVYAGYMGAFGGASSSFGVGTDIEMGPIVLQPSVGTSLGGVAGALSLFVRI